MLKYLSVEIIPECVIPAKAGIHRIYHLQVDTHGFRLKECRNDGILIAPVLIVIYASLY
jgi:hypothetical protein